jgi:hypothetical protein
MDISRLGPAAQKQVLEKLAAQERQKQLRQQMQAQQKESKYHNQKTQVGNVTFDSKKEARRFEALMILLEAGQIRDLKLQQQFTLQEAYTTPEGNRIRAIKYVADFTYYEPLPYENKYVYESAKADPSSWRYIVEDVKSKATMTRVYSVKKKLMREKFGIEISEG